MDDEHYEEETDYMATEGRESEREALIEDGEISAEEEAFMRGYDEAGIPKEEEEEE